jgi:hypothetical protein
MKRSRLRYPLPIASQQPPVRANHRGCALRAPRADETLGWKSSATSDCDGQGLPEINHDSSAKDERTLQNLHTCRRCRLRFDRQGPGSNVPVLARTSTIPRARLTRRKPTW